MILMFRQFNNITILIHIRSPPGYMINRLKVNILKVKTKIYKLNKKSLILLNNRPLRVIQLNMIQVIFFN